MASRSRQDFRRLTSLIFNVYFKFLQIVNPSLTTLTRYQSSLYIWSESLQIPQFITMSSIKRSHSDSQDSASPPPAKKIAVPNASPEAIPTHVYIVNFQNDNIYDSSLSDTEMLACYTKVTGANRRAKALAYEYGVGEDEEEKSVDKDGCVTYTGDGGDWKTKIFVKIMPLLTHEPKSEIDEENSESATESEDE